MKRHPIAVLCSDIHLDERPPVARSAEPDWFEAMSRPIRQLKRLAKKHDVPVVCAGDVFNRAKPPPELINYALTHLPDMYAVPGQHDLPLHAMKDIGKSAFGTLMQTGKIKLLEPGKPTLIKGAWLWGFPWNTDITPLPDIAPADALHVAVIHAYVWAKGATYPDAPDEKRVGVYRQKLKGYRTALFGDNHIPFLREWDELTVFNHGGFMRRRSDEVDHAPAIGLLMSDGSVELVLQDVSEDRFIPREEARLEEDASFNMHAFLKELTALGDSELDFVEAVKHYLRTYEVSPGAKKIILKTIHENVT